MHLCVCVFRNKKKRSLSIGNVSKAYIGGRARKTAKPHHSTAPNNVELRARAYTYIISLALPVIPDTSQVVHWQSFVNGALSVCVYVYLFVLQLLVCLVAIQISCDPFLEFSTRSRATCRVLLARVLIPWRVCCTLYIYMCV